MWVFLLFYIVALVVAVVLRIHQRTLVPLILGSAIGRETTRAIMLGLSMFAALGLVWRVGRGTIVGDAILISLAYAWPLLYVLWVGGLVSATFGRAAWRRGMS